MTAAIRARPTNFWSGAAAVASRAVRQIPREPEAIVPALVVPLFFFVVNIGALEKLAERGVGIDLRSSCPSPSSSP
jgi:ABC-2 type transport system permease protein